MTTAEFLARIRQRMPPGNPNQLLRPEGEIALALSERPAHPAAAVDIIRRQLSERWAETLGRFRAEFERVGGEFHRVSAAAEVPELVGRLARERQAERVITWHAAALGVAWSATLRAGGLTVDPMPPGALEHEGTRPALRRRIADADIGLTGADLAVAETGSLVLISGAGRPRSTSLLPPCHIAVFDRRALVDSLAQLGVFLEAWHGDGAPAWRGGAINVITGPSRTADIELTLTRGVHGPRELHAVFVDAEPEPDGGRG